MTQTVLNPDRALELTWQGSFTPVLDALNVRLDRPSKCNKDLAARALLEMLRDNNTVSIRDVVDSVKENDGPRGRWYSWDQTKWYEYVPPIVEALKSGSPMSVLQL